MLTLRYAWRNMWRNRNRTAITLAAVVINTAVLIVLYALCQGMMDDTVRNATNVFFGEVQVHAPKYKDKRSFFETVKDPAAVMKRAEALGAHGAPRAYGYGLAAHGAKSAGARFWGVDPAAERRAFSMADHLLEGKFLGGKPAHGVVLGRKLAYQLGVGVGDELVVLVQAADGSLGNDLYTVTGILKSMGEEIDRSAAVMHKDDFDELFVSYGFVHEVAVNSRGQVKPEVLAAGLNAEFPKQDAETWKQLLPLLSDMVAMFDGMMVLFVAVFSLAAGLGVLNAMLMATYERMREFGVIKALGASPWRIVGDVAAEALLLSLLGTALGTAVSLLACHYLANHGIDLTSVSGSISFSGVAFETVWRAALQPKMIWISAGVMTAICVLASLYPAALAARLDPVQVMRRQ